MTHPRDFLSARARRIHAPPLLSYRSRDTRVCVDSPDEGSATAVAQGSAHRPERDAEYRHVREVEEDLKKSRHLRLDEEVIDLSPASVHGGSSARCSSASVGWSGWGSVEVCALGGCGGFGVVGGSVGSGGCGVSVWSGVVFVHLRVWVSGVSPSVGWVEGGTRVWVWGSRVRETSTVRCRLGVGGGGASVGRCVGGSEVECGSAARSVAGRRRAEVSVNAQQFSASSSSFTYARSARASSARRRRTSAASSRARDGFDRAISACAWRALCAKITFCVIATQGASQSVACHHERV